MLIKRFDCIASPELDEQAILSLICHVDLGQMQGNHYQ
jgi:hypothetical protein